MPVPGADVNCFQLTLTDACSAGKANLREGASQINDLLMCSGVETLDSYQAKAFTKIPCSAALLWPKSWSWMFCLYCNIS